MEEVDALASRLVIMAAGSVRCLGTPQHLKSKFGDGYTLELRLGLQAAGVPACDGADQQAAATSADAEATSTVELLAAAADRAEHYFESVMPGVSLLEKEPGRLLLRLPLGSNGAQTASQAGQAVEPQQQQQQSQEDAGSSRVSTLSDVFEAVETARDSLCITEYSLAQSSLERVFLALAKAASHAADGD